MNHSPRRRLVDQTVLRVLPAVDRVEPIACTATTCRISPTFFTSRLDHEAVAVTAAPFPSRIAVTAPRNPAIVGCGGRGEQERENEGDHGRQDADPHHRNAPLVWSSPPMV
jgi:hypothetical protein